MAEILFSQNLKMTKKVFGEESVESIRTAVALGDLLLVREKGPEAESVFDQVVQTMSKVFGSKGKEMLLAVNNLATSLFEQKKYHEAEALLKGSLIGIV